METTAEVLKKIGLRFKKLRIDKGYKSYETFAIENKLSRMQYWRIETGRTNVTINSLVEILLIHKMSVEEFFSIKL